MPSTFIADFDRLADMLRGYGYDHDGEGGLPVRPDCLGFIERELILMGVLDDAPIPDVTLHGDGTLSFSFAHEDDRLLMLQVMCWGVVKWVRIFGCEDELDRPSAEGTLRAGDGDLLDAFEELHDFFDWLNGKGEL